MQLTKVRGTPVLAVLLTAIFVILGVAGHNSTTAPMKHVANTTVTSERATSPPEALAAAQPQANPPAAAPAPAKAKPATVSDLDQAQTANAKVIVDTAASQGVGPQGATIAVATAMQESNLYNRASPVQPDSYKFPHQGEGSDHASVGLFQQQPNWGPTQKLMDPYWSTTLFLHALKGVTNWQHKSLTDSAQAVQVSAYPDAYADDESHAKQVVDQLWP